MLCSNICACGLYSNSLVVTGSGQQGDAWQIETIFGGVYTSTTRPGTPVLGLSIYETDTKRQVTHDGTNWVIMAGQFPGCSAYTTGGAVSPANATTTDFPLVTEAYDIGGFHTGTNAYLTVPAGMAGDYIVSARLRFASGPAVGQRTCILDVGSNGGYLNPPNAATVFPTDGTNNTGVTQTYTYRLIAGATVTIRGYQTSGGALSLPDGSLSLDMIRHIPSLV